MELMSWVQIGSNAGPWFRARASAIGERKGFGGVAAMRRANFTRNP
jgi:hypothetical protein